MPSSSSNLCSSELDKKLGSLQLHLWQLDPHPKSCSSHCFCISKCISSTAASGVASSTPCGPCPRCCAGVEGVAETFVDKPIGSPPQRLPALQRHFSGFWLDVSAGLGRFVAQLHAVANPEAAPNAEPRSENTVQLSHTTRPKPKLLSHPVVIAPLSPVDSAKP